LFAASGAHFMRHIPPRQQLYPFPV